MSYLEQLFGLKGKVALVTGGSSGIGAMICESLVRAGAHVMIVSRKGDRCAAMAERLNTLDVSGSAEGFSGDVGTEESILALVQAVKDRTGSLDILFNNAGVTWGAPLADYPHDQWARTMAVNVASVFTLTRELLPLLEAAATEVSPARVLNIGSVMGTLPVAEGAYAYTASKGAVHHLTKTLAGELAAKHITVNAFAPGPFPSKMTAFATGSAEGAAKVGANVPLGRIGNAEDIAAATLYLCGRGGAYVSGAILPLDGGMSVVTHVNVYASP